METSSLRKWVAAYEVHGPDGVREKRRELYSREFKLKVLRRMRDEDLSYRQAAALFDIRNFNIIGTWERAYERDGMPGLAPQWAGRRKKMTTPENQKSKSSPREDDKRTREQLLEELQSLRLENAYLKKLDALVQSQAKSAPAAGDQQEEGLPCRAARQPRRPKPQTPGRRDQAPQPANGHHSLRRPGLARWLRPAPARSRHHAINRPAVNDGLQRTITYNLLYR